MLTPIAKSWPSEWCLEANSLAIQVLGGYGYTRDFPVEQYWRDNRLNMIHEGTHGIQALDLLGRKVVMDGGAGLDVVARGDRRDGRARRVDARRSASTRRRCARAADDVAAATRAAWSTGVPAEALANATPYLQAFGHLVLAWIWLDVARLRRRGAGERCPARPPRRLPLLLPLRAAAASAPGSASSQRATTPAGRWPRSRFEAISAKRIGTLIWVLIYGGLFAVGIGVALERAGESYGSAVIVVGAGRVVARRACWSGFARACPRPSAGVARIRFKERPT